MYASGIGMGIFMVAVMMIIVLAELDRTFSFDNNNPIGYYTEYKARPLLGAYNTVIRQFHDCPPYPDLDYHFPQHTILRDNWERIRDEALHVFNTVDIPSFNNIDASFERIGDDKWKTFMLRWYDGNIESNCKHMPFTSSLIDKMPEVYTCMLSILLPRKYIPPHVGANISCVRYHLCLQAPKKGYAQITVDHKPYVYKEGDEVMLDDTYEHEVINNSPDDDVPRIVLFIDVLRRLPGNWHVLNKWLTDQGRFTNFVNNVNAKAEVQQDI
jgi:beta-hydroxylase